MLPLTPAEIAELHQIINDHFTAMAIRVGVGHIPPEQVSRLVDRGVLEVGDISELGLIDDSYLLGAFQRELTKLGKDPREISFNDLKMVAQSGKFPELTPVERASAERARLWAGEKVQGLAGSFTGKVMDAIRSSEREVLGGLIAEALEQRQTIGQLESTLRDLSGDFTRDWLRVSVSEVHDAREAGVSNNLKSMFGPSVRVAKVPSPGACKNCLRLFTEPGGKPKIFELSELESNGTNHGRKVAEWLPTVGTAHPYCQCYLVHVPEGFDFNDDGDLVPVE